jgi:hypothetical protein
MPTYVQHGEFLTSVWAGAAAELAGFHDAKKYDVPQLYHTPRYQWRYEHGFNYAKHLLKREAVQA